jgi:type IV pilus assembly protein PilB
MPKYETPSEARQQEEDQRKTGTLSPAKTQAGTPRPFMTSFLEHLVRNRIISEEVAMQAAEWKKHNEKDKRSLVEILKEEFGLSQDVLHYQVAQFYAFRVIDINERGARRLLPTDVLKILRGLPESIRQVAMRHKVLPYDLAENQPDKIIVVTPNPADREISDVARALPYKKFEICYMKERDWAEYWRQLTLEKDQPGSSALAMQESVVEEEEADFEGAIDRDISRGQLQGLVENIFSDAARVGATDIHVIPRSARKTDVCFRIDGQLALWYTIEDTRSEAVVAVVKTRGQGMDRFERMAAQTGAVQKTVDSQLIRYSVSVLPVASRELSGKLESVVIRVQRDPDADGLDVLVSQPYALRVLKEALARPRGLIVLAGPSGGGRTATLIAALRSVMKPGLSTVTVEEPVEVFLEGARQIKINPKLAYDDALDAIIQHDTDIVYIGNLDRGSASGTALRLAVAGRQVFGKLHARDTVTAVARLLTAGIEPFMISEGIGTIIAQRQVRKLCERCKEPVTKVSRELVTRLGFAEDEASATKFYRAVGCINCTGGYKGRLPLHEALDWTDQIRDQVLWSEGKFDARAMRESAVKQGMVTIQQHGVELLKKGVTTLTEVAAALA